MLTPRQNLHYAIGELAYAIACADGKIQKEERKKFHDMVAAEIRCGDPQYELADINFQLLEKDKISPATAYEWAMKEIRTNSHYLSPELKNAYIQFMEKIAKAYPPVTINETDLIKKFRKDIEPIHGDPVYYLQK